MSAASDGYIDLRSDTVTRPTPEMRRAMADAEVGDDWYGDDPTVNRLQEDAAGLTGHEAALYLPTGTLCNQIALHAYVRSGGFVACEATAHVGGTEAASAAALSGIAFRRIPAPRGLLSAEQVAAALEPDPYDVEHVGLVTVENTHQRGGGSVLPVADLAAIAKICASRDTPLYLDGARIFNAAVVAGTTVAEYTRHVDALMFCLSKGLGAPIGSLLAGSREFIAGSTPAENPVRRGLAAGRDHGRGRPDRAAGRPRPAGRGSRERPAAGRGRGRDRAGGRGSGQRPDQHGVRGRGRDGLAAAGMGAAAGRGRAAGHGGAGAGADAHPRRRDRAGYRDGAGRLAPRRV